MNHNSPKKQKHYKLALRQEMAKTFENFLGNERNEKIKNTKLVSIEKKNLSITIPKNSTNINYTIYENQNTLHNNNNLDYGINYTTTISPPYSPLEISTINNCFLMGEEEEKKENEFMQLIYNLNDFINNFLKNCANHNDDDEEEEEEEGEQQLTSKMSMPRPVKCVNLSNVPHSSVQSNDSSPTLSDNRQNNNNDNSLFVNEPSTPLEKPSFNQFDAFETNSHNCGHCEEQNGFINENCQINNNNHSGINNNNNNNENVSNKNHITQDVENENPIKCPAKKSLWNNTVQKQQSLPPNFCTKTKEKNQVDHEFRFLKRFEIRLLRISGIQQSGCKHHNFPKNRYKNILPNENTRVQLNYHDRQEPGSDYINANSISTKSIQNFQYIDHFRDPPQYIATQAPLPYTFGDFWQMIVEKDCKTIIMLTNSQSNTNSQTFIDTCFSKNRINKYFFYYNKKIEYNYYCFNSNFSNEFIFVYFHSVTF